MEGRRVKLDGVTIRRPLPGHGLGWRKAEPRLATDFLEVRARWKDNKLHHMSLILQKYVFPRRLALHLSGGLFSLNAFPSGYHSQAARAQLSARHHFGRAPSGSVHTKRRHRFIGACSCGSPAQFHINFVLIVLPHIGWATSTTPHSTASDPSEEEALLCLEQGTQKLEEGDVEGAKKLYQRSVDIKRNASSLFNLGVTHYHLSSCSS